MLVFILVLFKNHNIMIQMPARLPVQISFIKHLKKEKSFSIVNIKIPRNKRIEGEKTEITFFSLSGFIDFIVAPTMNVCGDVVSCILQESVVSVHLTPSLTLQIKSVCRSSTLLVGEYYFSSCGLANSLKPFTPRA